jgi:transcriptional regulator with XRE-family HTH domain
MGNSEKEASEFNKQARAGFGTRLEGVRGEQKLTRSQLAAACDMHYDAILKLERGDRHPTLATMCVIADALGLKVTALLPEG